MHRPKVFVSYSNKDAVLARLMIECLEENDVECFFSERDIAPGKEFDEEIAARIRGADLLLVIWTAHSQKSIWVNQELAAATALHIPVVPIKTDDEDLRGFIATRQACNLLGVKKPREAIAELGRKEIPSIIRAAVPSGPLYEKLFPGPEERLRGLLELLDAERAQVSSDYTLRLQSFYSPFSISADPAIRTRPYHTPEYHEFLMRERQEIVRMATKCRVKAIVFPIHAYKGQSHVIRIRTLIEYLSDDDHIDSVRVVFGPHDGTTSYIFNDRAVFGSVFHSSDKRSGHRTSYISFDRREIVRAIHRFDERFDELWEEHLRRTTDEPLLDESLSEPQRVRTRVRARLERLLSQEQGSS